MSESEPRYSPDRAETLNRVLNLRATALRMKAHNFPKALWITYRTDNTDRMHTFDLDSLANGLNRMAFGLYVDLRDMSQQQTLNRLPEESQ